MVVLLLLYVVGLRGHRGTAPIVPRVRRKDSSIAAIVLHCLLGGRMVVLFLLYLIG